MPAAAIEGPCLRCRTGENIFDFARSAVFFNDAAREIIHHLKYADRVSLAGPIGTILREVLIRERFTGDLVVPVPLHWKRRRSRGFNQAELIARELGVQVGNNIIRRKKNTETQTGLSRSERMKNLSAAFELLGTVANRKIILVDDVLTTGATMNEIAKVLKRGGAKKVEALTFSRVPDSINGL